MARSYKAILNQHKCRWWLQRTTEDYSGDISLIIHTDDGAGKSYESPPLSTYEIGALATHFARIYFERTKKVVWPVSGSMLHVYEKARIDAADEMYEWMRASPATENNRLAEPYAVAAGLKAATEHVPCEFCDELGDCTGECV